MWAPGITVREAIILAKFTEEEDNTKSMQRKVSRDLQKKTESKGKANATIATADLVPPVEDVDFNGNAVLNIKPSSWRFSRRTTSRSIL